MLDEFIRQLPLYAPPLSRISQIQWEDLHTAADGEAFRIVASRPGCAAMMLTADIATCQLCLDELADSADRRYRYPFGNCTHCGPRLSIIRRLPYDRNQTSMAGFPLCPACEREYRNPADRRFHAQAIACPACGPRVWLEDGHGDMEAGRDPITVAAGLIRQGYIIAVKGLGGFNLVCDAGNQNAVLRLRDRKQRMAKPFAIMARDSAILAEYVQIDEQARQLLAGQSAPIVLLNKQGRALASAVAPHHLTLGCILPYTPLHHLLLQNLDAPIVFTSGNRGAEPQAVENGNARQSLAGLADYWLMHDRDIVIRLDDSVLQIMDGQPRLLRRSRGYAPLPMPLPPGFPAAAPILAMGAALKNTFCLLKDGQAILSPHIGDLENAETQSDYRRMLDWFQALFHFQPQHIAVDMHPGYLSTQFGREWAAKQGLPVTAVQHHHAHIAACMAEHGLPLESPPVLGVAMDGLGMGEAGQFWGGEFFEVDYRQYRRLAAFHPIAMPGGVQAIRQPWRNCYAHLQHYFDWPVLSRRYAGLDIMRFLDSRPLVILDTMLAKNLNSPVSSSCGRCLDAFAAALGVCAASIDYEAQAAIELEALAAPVFRQQKANAYRHENIGDSVLPLLGWRPFWQAMLNDLQRGVAKADIAARIHHGLANAIAETADGLADQIGCRIVILSGGVFQNRLLLEEVSRQLRSAGKIPLSPAGIPCHDGGLALGQGIIVAGRLAG